MKHWETLRTAYEIAQSGTVTAAADSLNMHRATVIRHIDTLEAELGVKLFQRHGRGYTLTEAGEDLLRVTARADSEFSQLKARIQGRNELLGEFVITSLEFIAPVLMPALTCFQQQHPKLHIRYISSVDLFKLEYGQAHIAIRSGEKPSHPDYVVQPFSHFELGLFAHRDYLAKYGALNSVQDFINHQFVMVGPQAGFAKASINQWLDTHVPKENVALYSNSRAVLNQAVNASMGIGVMLKIHAQENTDLVEVYPHNPDWFIYNWLVTHGDLHRSEKVQQFLHILKLTSN